MTRYDHEAFDGLRKIVWDHMEVPVYAVAQGTYSYVAGQFVAVPCPDTESLLHEICHWLVASEDGRREDDFGIEKLHTHESHVVELAACLLEIDIQRKAGLEPNTPSWHLSLDPLEIRGAAHREALFVRARQVVEEVNFPGEMLEAIVEAMKLPGGANALFDGGSEPTTPLELLAR